MNGERELAILRRFADANVPASAELKKQLLCVTIIDVTRSTDFTWGELVLAVSPAAPPLPSCIGFPLRGSYQDNDGGTVSVLLFAGAKTNRLSTLEFWRSSDPGPILCWPPDPAFLSLSAGSDEPHV